MKGAQRHFSVKVILATNIAESSITVPDISIIFDSCLRKDVFYDWDTKCFSLNEQWISKDCADQRKGRAGRVGPGVVSFLYWLSLNFRCLVILQGCRDCAKRSIVSSREQ